MRWESSRELDKRVLKEDTLPGQSVYVGGCFSEITIAMEMILPESIQSYQYQVVIFIFELGQGRLLVRGGEDLSPEEEGSSRYNDKTPCN